MRALTPRLCEMVKMSRADGLCCASLICSESRPTRMLTSKGAAQHIKLNQSVA